MDDIFKRIIEIEDKAQNIVEDAKKESDSFDSHISDITEEMYRNIDKRADDKINDIRKIESEFQRTSIEEIKLNYQTNLDRINKIYEENKEQWVLAVFNTIIGGR